MNFRFFVRSGNMSLSNPNPLNNPGQNGYYWSPIASSHSNFAYSLGFYNSYPNPSAYYNFDRFGGFSLRCLAS